MQTIKRFLSFVMAFAMVFSMLPVQVMAAETEPHEHIEETTAPTETTVETAAPVEPTEASSVPATEAATIPTETVSETTPVTEAEKETVPATEVAAPEVEATEETAPVSEEAQNPVLVELQAQINDILTWYLGTTQMDAADVYAAVAAMDQDTYWSALVEVDDWENSDAVLQLSEEDAQTLADDNTVFSDFGSALYERRANDDSIALYDGTVTAVEGISVTASSTTSGPTLSNGSVTITRKGGFLSAKTANITIANAGDKTANITFSYAFSGNGSATLNGSSITSGTYSGTLDAGATVTMTVTGSSGSKTGTLTLSNFSRTEVSANATATVTYDSAKGSVNLGGTAVASGGSATATNGTLAAVATPASGYSFVAWINTDTNELLSASSSATLNVPQNMNIQALFVKSDGTDTAWFLAGGSIMYNDLNAASNYAATVSTKTVVLMNNATLPAGNYTIPAGVTLLIPFNDSNTLYTTNHKDAGGLVEGGTTAATGAYRTLTMADGANITVNGAISLSAKLNAPGGGKTNAGAPTGKVPYIKMQGNSNITLNNGAKLYCYGFITGSGSVTAKSGATVYESFQIRDYRGGSGSSGIKNSVFPSSQYYIQNVEVPMTFEAGSSLKGVSAVTVSVVGVTYMSDISVIGSSDSLFTNAGNVTKRYDGTTDRLIVDIDGNASVGSIALKFGNWGGSIDSADYVLGLNNNMTVNILSGTTTTAQRLAIQPGAILTIAEGANVVLNKNLYVYDADQWGDFVYCETITDGIEYEGTDFTSVQDVNNWAAIPVSFAPGKAKTRTFADLVDAQIDVNGTLTATSANIYTTAGGANITSSKGTGSVVLTAGTDTITYQADMDSSSNLKYHNISITSAKLKNSNGEYTETAGASNTTYNYCANHGLWYTGECSECATACPHTNTETLPAVAPTCTATGLTEGTKCSDCGEVIDAQEEVPATGHTEETIPAVAPTCTTAGKTEGTKCSACGTVIKAQEDVPATGHTEETIPGKAASCTETGLTNGVKCSVCGEILTAQEEIPTTGHTEVIDKAVAPTCTETGLTEGKHCSVCGTVTVEQKEIAKLPHTETTIPAVAPTCTTAGKTEGTKCSACGTVIKAQEDVPATGHTEETIPGKAASCTETGLTEGKKCAICGEITVAQEEIAALGHTEVIDKAVAPTCTETGLTEGKHCSVCNTVLVAQVTVDALGHTEVVDAAKAPTCTKTGLTEGKHCSVCDEVLVAQEVVPATGHTEETIPGKAASCTETGLTDGVKCSVCKEVLVAQTEVAAPGHKYNAVVTDPTCENAGYTTYTCSVCGDSYVADEVAALDHDYEAVVADPTFDADGYTTYTCSRCDDSYVETNEGSQLIAVAKIGEKKFQSLSEAFGVAEEGDIIELLKDHTVTSNETWDLTGKTLVIPSGIRIIIKGCDLTIEGGTFNIDGAITNYCGLTINNGTFYLKNQSITTDGAGNTLKIHGGEFHVSEGTGIYVRFAMGYIYNGTFTVDEGAMILGTSFNNSVLTVSGGSYSQDVTEYLSDGYCCPLSDGMYVVGVHTPAEAAKENEVEADCENAGSYDNVVRCSGCNAELSRETIVVPASGHDYDAVVTAPTCADKGYTTYTCSACGDSYVGDETEAAGHSYTPVVTAPTCTDAGYTTYTCSACGDSNVGDEVAALGHTEVIDAAKAPTCTEAGLTEGKHCSVCGEVLVKQEVVAALGHTEVIDAAVAPDCENTGLTEGKHCSVCNEVIVAQEEVAALGHTHVTVDEIPATCTTSGKSAGVKCSICDVIITAVVDVPALGHAWNEGVVDKAATCTEAGKKTLTCTRDDCGVTKTEEIAALGHTEVEIPAVDATCVEPGATAGVKCSVCDAVITASTEIPATGHNYVDGVCSTCGESNISTYQVVMDATELSYDAEIVVRMKVKIPDELLTEEKAYLVLTKDGRWGPVQRVYTATELKTMGTDASGRYVTEIGVASGEMTRKIKVEVFDGEEKPVNLTNKKGKILGTSVECSVTDFAKAVLSSSTSTAGQKDMATKLVTYGGYAQKYFGVDTDTPAYEILTDLGVTIPDLSGITSSTITDKPIQNSVKNGVAANSFDVELNSATCLRISLALDAGENINNYEFTLTYTEGGNTKTKSIAAKIHPDNGKYCVEIPDIPAAYWDYMYKVSITNKTTGEIYEVSASVLTWIRQTLKTPGSVEQANMAKAMYLYNQAANNFFNK